MPNWGHISVFKDFYQGAPVDPPDPDSILAFLTTGDVPINWGRPQLSRFPQLEGVYSNMCLQIAPFTNTHTHTHTHTYTHACNHTHTHIHTHTHTNTPTHTHTHTHTYTWMDTQWLWQLLYSCKNATVMKIKELLRRKTFVILTIDANFNT